MKTTRNQMVALALTLASATLAPVAIAAQFTSDPEWPSTAPRTSA